MVGLGAQLRAILLVGVRTLLGSVLVALPVAGVAGTASAGVARVGYDHGVPAHAYDGFAHSVQAHTSAVAPIVPHEVDSRGTQGTSGSPDGYGTRQVHRRERCCAVDDQAGQSSGWGRRLSARRDPELRRE